MSRIVNDDGTRCRMPICSSTVAQCYSRRRNYPNSYQYDSDYSALYEFSQGQQNTFRCGPSQKIFVSDEDHPLLLAIAQ
jgi:hypothetical protein